MADPAGGAGLHTPHIPMHSPVVILDRPSPAFGVRLLQLQPGRILALARRAADADPTDRRRQVDLAGYCQAAGAVPLKAGDEAGVTALFGEGLDAARRVRQAAPSFYAAATRYLNLSLKLGDLRLSAGEKDRAMELCRDAVAAVEPFARFDPANVEFQSSLPEARYYLGEVAGERVERLAGPRTLLLLLAARLTADPGDARTKAMLATTRFIAGLDVAFLRPADSGSADREADARRELSAAVAGFEELCRLNPDNLAWPNFLLKMYPRAAAVAGWKGAATTDLWLKAAVLARDTAARVVGRMPADVPALVALATAESGLWAVWTDARRWPEALAQADRAVTAWERACQVAPDHLPGCLGHSSCRPARAGT